MTGPLEAAAQVVGDRWNLLICDALMAGPLRFADLQRQVTGVSATVLSRRLRDLEAGGVLVAEPYSQRPRRHRYRLTDRGRALAPALVALARWGEDLLDADSREVMGIARSVDQSPEQHGDAEPERDGELDGEADGEAELAEEDLRYA